LQARRPTRQDGGAGLRFDGLYKNDIGYLRFYPDGRVAGASTFDDARTAARWLGSSAADSRGRYRLRDTGIAFTLDGMMATVQFAGHVLRDGLQLEAHSLKNGRRAPERYTFEPVDFAAAGAAAGTKSPCPKILKGEDDPQEGSVSLLVDRYDMAFVGTQGRRPRTAAAGSGGDKGQGRDWSVYDFWAGVRLSLRSVPRGEREGRAASVFRELETRLKARFSEQQGYGLAASKPGPLAKQPHHVYIRKEEGWEFSVFLRPSDGELNELVVHRTQPWGQQFLLILKVGGAGMILTLLVLFFSGWYSRGHIDWPAFLWLALVWSLPAFLGWAALRALLLWLFLRPGLKRDEADIDRIIDDVLRDAAADLGAGRAT
jgi:hypothetical protein